MPLNQHANLFNRFSMFALILFLAGCQSVGPHQTAGTAMGGVAGGLTGAAIGARQGKSIEGGVMGATVGMLAGAAIGNSQDRIEQTQLLAQQQRQQQLQAASVSVDDVIRMTREGLSEDVIRQQIQNQGVWRRPSQTDLLNLKNNGVSDRVIIAFQTAPTVSQPINMQPVMPSVVRPAPVVVETRPVVGVALPFVPKYYAPRGHRGRQPFPYRRR